MSMHSFPSRPPFMFLSRDQTRKVTLNGQEVEVRIMIHGAYNVFGLIGSECNGIGIATEPTWTKHKKPRIKTKGDVLVRGALRADSGYSAPTPQQLEVYNDLLTCHSAKFIDFVQKWHGQV